MHLPLKQHCHAYLGYRTFFVISTLIEERNPSSERFIPLKPHYKPDASRAIDQFRLVRPVRRNGITYGAASLCFSCSLWDTTTETRYLCPYYDPVARALRFRQPDGQDFNGEKPLAELIARKGCQPLLHLAYAENLIEKVPCM